MDEAKASALDAILASGPVIPVVTVGAERDAVPLARALLAGGIRVIEVTLRSPAGLGAIARIAAEVPDMVVGGGTVLTGKQAHQCQEAGARFLVSPGLTEALSDAAADLAIPLLPGIATPSDAMFALDAGLTRLKFFPAEPAGGVPMLKALHGPFATLRFCPTGGIDLAAAPAYLACPNVACVGGSWLTPGKAIEEGAWTTITETAAHTLHRLKAS